MFIRGARAGILFLVVAILVSGCVPSTPATSTDAPASAASSPGARLFGSFGKQAIASVMDVLTRAGIEVDTNYGRAVNAVAGPASPVHVNQTQLRNMTLEVTSNSGTRGRTLDGLVPSPTAGAPGPAEWIAAYADKADTVGGTLARQLLAPQDLHKADDLVIPLGAAHSYKRRLPGSRLEVFDAVGHCPQLEQPARFNALLDEFLAS